MLDRGMDGVTPRTLTLADESYLDFGTSLRNLAIEKMFPRIGEEAVSAASAAGLPDAGETADIDSLLNVADALPDVMAWKRIMRTQQVMSWDRVMETADANRGQLEAALDEAEKAAPDRLKYDPNFVVPDYAKPPIHLQPGGYVGDSLAGYVFHWGTKTFYQGYNDQDELHQMVAGLTEVPKDGPVKRILDIGCSIGQATTALKLRFPDAEIEGLDVALPLVRYGHKRALDLGIDVTFIQALAEDTGLETGAYDAILAHILFHEVPIAVTPQVVAEVARLLRPGGVFTIIDAPRRNRVPVPQRIWMQFDAELNCEPYSPDFVTCDFEGMLAANGFEITERGPTPTFLEKTVAVKKG